MELLQESLLAFFAAVGIAWTAWTAAEALFLSRWERRETVAGLLWTTVCGRKLERILIAACGLDDTGREVARRLARQNAAVALCTMDSAGEFL